MKASKKTIAPRVSWKVGAVLRKNWLLTSILLVLILGTSLRSIWAYSDTQKKDAQILEGLVARPTTFPGMKIDDFDQMLRARGEVEIIVTTAPIPLTPTRMPSPVVAVTSIPNPTPNTNPQVNCLYDSRCGGTKQTSKDECTNTVCCYDGTQWAIRTKSDCQKITDDFAKKQRDDWNTEQARIKAEIETMQKTTEALVTQNQQRQDQLLEDCRNQAQNTYKQAPAGSNAGGLGYVVGESAEIRQKLNQAMARCLELYGGAQ